jgi:uncharacterized cofD-like protein
MMSEPHPGLSIVSIGGGTGLSTLLSGLKHFVHREGPVPESPDDAWIESLTAIVTVTDDGGSSGRLREEFQILPPGDIRNCMVALAEDERLLTRLFQYRFESEGHLSGHSFGNLFLAALADVTGDFLEAIKLSSEVLAIKGRIFPSTMEDVELVADLEDGRLIKGETNIVNSRSRIKRLRLSHSPCRPLPESLDAIRHADIITIGPGSLYTSILPNLLVEGIVEAIRDSAGVKLFVLNIMTQPGETDGFSAEDHVRVLLEYSPELALDFALVNTAPVSATLRERYLADGAVQVEIRSRQGLEPRLVGGKYSVVSMGTPPLRATCGDLLMQNEVLRHDPRKLAQLVLDVFRAERALKPHLVGSR